MLGSFCLGSLITLILQVFIANIGDAKAVLARSSEAGGSLNHSDGERLLKAIVLTREHKAIYPQERARIQKVLTEKISVQNYVPPPSLHLFLKCFFKH